MRAITRTNKIRIVWSAKLQRWMPCLISYWSITDFWDRMQVVDMVIAINMANNLYPPGQTP
jgi:hypothetical protein